MKRLTARISGRVQGVSFRYYTRREATRLGVRGWVRNEADGSVRVLAEGSQDSLGELLEFLERGSPSARVRHVEVDWSAATGEFDTFEVRFV
ncbi:MAG: acylphosphatase [Chloroflexota bacterium]|jgi:acylphosphatase